MYGETNNDSWVNEGCCPLRHLQVIRKYPCALKFVHFLEPTGSFSPPFLQGCAQTTEAFIVSCGPSRTNFSRPHGPLWTNCCAALQVINKCPCALKFGHFWEPTGSFSPPFLQGRAQTTEALILSCGPSRTHFSRPHGPLRTNCCAAL